MKWEDIDSATVFPFGSDAFHRAMCNKQQVWHAHTYVSISTHICAIYKLISKLVGIHGKINTLNIFILQTWIEFDVFLASSVNIPENTRRN